MVIILCNKQTQYVRKIAKDSFNSFKRIKFFLQQHKSLYNVGDSKDPTLKKKQLFYEIELLNKFPLNNYKN